MLESEVLGPVRARVLPEGPSATREEEADLYPVGRVTVETGVVVTGEVPTSVKTLFEREARAVLSGKHEEIYQWADSAL